MKSSREILSLKTARTEEPISELCRALLTELGEDPSRLGLVRTPSRVARSLRFLTQGYDVDAEAILTGALFAEDHDEMVTVTDIAFYSLCEHHLLPFYGRVHVAYVPRSKIVGLSKIPRLVDAFSRRLQVQERLTRQIAETMQRVLNPKGVAVVIEAEHLCMQMRGVQKQGSKIVTSSMQGVFRSRQETRQEFMNLIRS